ncbi:MAG TPA: SURF1 family protein [Candidatus Limnocylindria bacterium]|nr:SURF1 family protein [Candidatus Limnocylindria bacterium]
MTTGVAVTSSPWRSPRWWGTTVLVLLGVLACVVLGAWQFDRARTRDTPVASGDPMATAAVPITKAVPADGRVPQGSPPVAVTVAGRYDGDHQLLVPGREQAGSPVAYVVTPLVPSSGPAVLVVRGSVPAAQPSGQAPAAPSGEVTVTGWLVPSEQLEAGAVDPLALADGEVATVTAARIAGLLPYPIVDGYVGLVDQQPVAVNAPTPLAVPQVAAQVRWSMRSLSYALEWWFFALVGIWMWVQALRLERRRAPSGEQAAAQPDGASAAAPPVPPAS